MRRKPHDAPAAHGPRGPAHWLPGTYERAELARALLAGRVAGPETSHDRHNVKQKIANLVGGDPVLQFGLTGLGTLSTREVLALMSEASGFDGDLDAPDGPSAIDPHRVLTACEAAGVRLARAAARGEHVLLATGHPGGLLLLYGAVGALLHERGAKLLSPLDGGGWREDGKRREIRYYHGVAVYTSRADMLHTHSPEPMERMLAEPGPAPDLVFADHGFAGAAIEAGIETISIVDVNDPAPVVARALGRTEHVICMDDNVLPESYWPCFQAIAAGFPRAAEA